MLFALSVNDWQWLAIIVLALVILLAWVRPFRP